MSIPLAYFSIVLIWSTTPLAIQWSTQGAGFALAVLLRMLIGLLLVSLIVLVARIGLPLHARARRAYFIGGLGTFGAMTLTYWGSRYLHSGLVSVLWGLSPLMAGLLAAVLLGEKSLTPLKIGGTLLGIAGLALIFLQGDSLGGAHALAGLLALLLAVLIHNGVMLWLQHIGDDSPPLATTLGSLAVAVPLFALCWWLIDGELPNQLPSRTSGAIVYLGVVGSVVGFALYYYVIKHLHASKVSLITLVTPVLALLLGNLLNGENISPRLCAGAGTILLGLLVHQWDGVRPLLVQSWGRLRSA
mgnify:CR=1 FL=1